MWLLKSKMKIPCGDKDVMYQSRYPSCDMHSSFSKCCHWEDQAKGTEELSVSDPEAVYE